MSNFDCHCSFGIFQCRPCQMLFLSVLTDGILEVEVVSCDLSPGNRTSLWYALHMYMLQCFSYTKFSVFQCFSHTKISDASVLQSYKNFQCFSASIAHPNFRCLLHNNDIILQEIIGHTQSSTIVQYLSNTPSKIVQTIPIQLFCSPLSNRLLSRQR